MKKRHFKVVGLALAVLMALSAALVGCGNVDSPAQTSAAAPDGGVAGTGTPAVSAAEDVYKRQEYT